MMFMGNRVQVEGVSGTATRPAWPPDCRTLSHIQLARPALTPDLYFSPVPHVL